MLQQDTLKSQIELKELEIKEKFIDAWKAGGAQVPQIVGADGLNLISDLTKEAK